jgi:hypothetical protein
MNELTPFKKGDWIIATKPRMEQREAGMFMSMGMVSVPDRKFMHRPVQVHAVTEAHIVVTWPSRFSTGKQPMDVLPLDEVQERGFIIAAPELVEIAGEL